jgi:hypothetical protein
MMAFAIATIVIMFCVIVTLSIYIVRERKAHMIEINDLEADADAFDMNANMHISALSEDKAKLKLLLTEQLRIAKDLIGELVYHGLRPNVTTLCTEEEFEKEREKSWRGSSPPVPYKVLKEQSQKQEKLIAALSTDKATLQKEVANLEAWGASDGCPYCDFDIA